MRSNVVLTGMPGVGKSTLGVLLAKALAKSFLDTDLVIQSYCRQPLQQILDERGPAGFRAIEEHILLELDCRDTVVATGGSAIYSEPGVSRLRRDGVVVFLDLDLAEVEHRLTNLSVRGVVRVPGQSLADVYEERLPLYRRHADLTVDCNGLRPDQAVERIISALASAA